MSVARHVVKGPFIRARIPGWISPWVHPGFRGEKRPKILGTSSGAKFEKQSNTAKHKKFNFRAYHSLIKWMLMMWNIQQAMQDDAIRTARINPAFVPVTGLKFSCGKISSLRSKRFRLVSEQKKNEERDFRFWLREKWNESLSSPPLPALLFALFFARSLTLVPRSLLLNRTEALATQATKFPARLRGSRSEKPRSREPSQPAMNT